MGKHGFSGACAPNGGYSGFDTFSVGVFEWVPAKSGNGTKRGKVKVRVRGLTNDPEKVFAKAREVAEKLDAGTYVGPKTVNLVEGKTAD